MVVLAKPGDGLARRKAVEDGQRGQGCSGATDAAAAGDFDAFSVPRAAVRLVQGIEGIGAVNGNRRSRASGFAGGARWERRHQPEAV